MTGGPGAPPPLRLALVTLGDPMRLTGGFLYHLRVAEIAPRHGARIDFVSFPDRPFPRPLLAAGRVLGEVRRLGARAILLDSLAAAYLGPALWLRPPGVPVLGILHQPPGGYGQGLVRTAVQGVLDRLSYARCARLLIASQSLADDLAAAGFPRGKLEVAAPGCDVAEAPGPAPENLRRGRRAALLCVANWLPLKDLHSLLEAFASLPEETATLHLAGDEDADPAYGARIRARLARPDLRDRVVRHGRLDREAVGALYAGADAFVLASLRETYGTVYGEAMAAGLPVVGWRAGNLPHLARHEREGLVVDTGDLPGLSEALARLSADEVLRRRLGAAARERARSFPTWDDTTRLIVSAARRAVDGRS